MFEEESVRWLGAIENSCKANQIAVMKSALESAFNKGMNHVSYDRNKVSVHGTDGCSRCETGRITLYAGSRICVGCQHEMEKKGGTQAD